LREVDENDISCLEDYVEHRDLRGAAGEYLAFFMDTLRRHNIDQPSTVDGALQLYGLLVEEATNMTVF